MSTSRDTSVIDAERALRKDVCKGSVNPNGSLTEACKNLNFASDKDVMLANVQKNGMALQYASEKLRKRENIVLAAVRQNGMALEYASKKKKDDERIVRAAIEQNPTAIQFASLRMQTAFWNPLPDPVSNVLNNQQGGRIKRNRKKRRYRTKKKRSSKRKSRKRRKIN